MSLSLRTILLFTISCSLWHSKHDSCNFELDGHTNTPHRGWVEAKNQWLNADRRWRPAPEDFFNGNNVSSRGPSACNGHPLFGRWVAKRVSDLNPDSKHCQIPAYSLQLLRWLGYFHLLLYRSLFNLQYPTFITSQIHLYLHLVVNTSSCGSRVVL